MPDRNDESWSRAPRLPRWLGWYAELLALWGLTVALPVLDSFAASPEQLIYRRADASDIVLFALGVTFLVPTLLLGLEMLLRMWSEPARRIFHGVMIVGLFALAGWLLVERHLATGWLGHAGTACLAAVAGYFFLRFKGSRTVLRFVAVVPVWVAFSFLALGPVSDIAFADSPTTSGGTPVRDPAPIAMLVLDELPTVSLLDANGEIDEDLYPGFTRLARDSTFYRNHSTVSPTTPEAVPSILTGKYPSELGEPPITPTHPDNLFTALTGAYQLNVWEISTQLCPPETCPSEGGAASQGLGPLIGDAVGLWTDYVDEPPPTEQEEFAIRQSDPSAPDRFDRFLDSMDGGPDDIRLDYLHTLFPHQPWRHLPSGQRHDGPFLAEGLGTPGYYWQSDYHAEAARQRHVLQLQRADSLVLSFLERLEEMGRYDETLVIVIADHGVAFETGSPIRGVSTENIEEVMWTPLFVKEPAQVEGRTDDTPLETVDVLPTLADIIGLDLTWETDGSSPQPQPPDDQDRRRLYPWSLNTLEPMGDSPYVAVDGAEGFRRLLDTEPVDTAGTGDPLTIYRIGMWGALVGEPVDIVAHDRAVDGAVATLLDPEDNDLDREWFDVRAEDDVIPVYVRGSVEGDGIEAVAVAVNGTIGGWGQVVEDEGERRFFALVPPALLEAGTNEITVFAIDEVGGEPLLSPLTMRWDLQS